MEFVSARRKVGVVRQENARLTPQDEQLIDALQYELGPPTSQVLGGSWTGVNNSVVGMSEQIRQLEAELEAQSKELKAAKLRAECCQEETAQGDIVVAALSEELQTLRDELDNKTALGKRAEQQRNQALQNAERLREAFKDYKASVSIKLKKVMESESQLKESLIECDGEKEELQVKFRLLEQEKLQHDRTISQLQEKVRNVKATAADLQSQAEESRRKSSEMERQLAERTAECTQATSLCRELGNLRALNHSQEQRLAQSHREAEQSQAELAGLEATLALLHVRQGPGGPFCASPCMLPQIDYSGTAQLLKLKPGEGYQQLLRALQTIEAERLRQMGLNERLQERLSRAQEEMSSLQSSMAQRASHFQNLHSELLDKASQAADTEKELKRKSARAAALEKQLQEKTSAYSLAALKKTELENQLTEKTSRLQHYQSLMTQKQREYQQSLEGCKQSQSQLLTEQQHRIEKLQRSVTEAQSRVLEMEQELRSLQEERDAAQRAAVQLQTCLDRLAQEQQAEAKLKQELLESFKEQTSRSAAKICELQSSLSACKEKLKSFLRHMDEVKSDYETKLRTKRDQVSSLQEKLHSTNLTCQSSTEQNLQLQLCLQQQQSMLTESTARVSELEESQSQLQSQVSSLEQQVERARTCLQDEVRSREQDAQTSDKTLQEMKQHNARLSKSISHLTSEMEKCQAERLSKESELDHLKRDVSLKNCRISSLEEKLGSVKSQLVSKTDTVEDLEKKLHRSEAEQLYSVQRVQILEGQLQAAQGELAGALERLQELRDVLQRTQTISEEREAQVDKLTVQLSEAQRDLEDRTHEVLDLDNALKERQGELQQRAKLLDAAIKDHKQEMEMKAERLQRSLEARESQLEEVQRELSSRNTKGTWELGVCQQKLQKALEELKETQLQREALTRELDATKMRAKEKEAELCSLEEEVALKEACWLQAEAKLQSTISALEQQLELEKEQHGTELESLQQTRGQLLKVSEQISSSMRSSQEQLALKLQQSHTQLEEAKALCEQTKAQLEQTRTELDYARAEAGHLQTELEQSRARDRQGRTELEQSRILQEETRAQKSRLEAQLQQLEAQLRQSRIQLHAPEETVETPNDLLITESETTRLQARISGLGRAADRQNLNNHTLPPALPPASPKRLQTPLCTSSHAPSVPAGLATQTQPRPLNPAPSAPSDPRPASELSDWQQMIGIDSSLDLPPSLKATLREVFNKQPWDCSSSSVSSFPESVDRSWQGLGATDASVVSDVSFNPLTYVVDKQGDPDTEARSSLHGREEPHSESRRRASTGTVGGQEDETDLSSLTEMLRFVNQTLARQEDPSVWTST
ncbi:coiled-coil domain-containing protein 18 isoform X2 [Cololabis saira]|uniref:coiled-coil domain-containing protein 18 isoform X2 n=1 Tax=Cololabis saira TaxID=129043 RepID=UPI002AD3E126|nr:coiled-coil domain-containing protein 18 isoform X2 [Cololabis saira]